MPPSGLSSYDFIQAFDHRREDLGKGVRGKYYDSYKKGTNLVLISPDVAEVFSSEEAVNDALRSLIAIAQKTTEPHRAKKHG